MSCLQQRAAKQVARLNDRTLRMNANAILIRANRHYGFSFAAGEERINGKPFGAPHADWLAWREWGLAWITYAKAIRDGKSEVR